jgi:hypothetical protein
MLLSCVKNSYIYLMFYNMVYLERDANKIAESGAGQRKWDCRHTKIQFQKEKIGLQTDQNTIPKRENRTADRPKYNSKKRK